MNNFKNLILSSAVCTLLIMSPEIHAEEKVYGDLCLNSKFTCGPGSRIRCEPLQCSLTAAISTGCEPCPAGTYQEFHKNEENCEPCPANSTSCEGATSINFCSCNKNFYMDNDGICQKCPLLSSTIKIGAKRITECICPPSMRLSGTECVCRDSNQERNDDGVCVTPDCKIGDVVPEKSCVCPEKSIAIQYDNENNVSVKLSKGYKKCNELCDRSQTDAQTCSCKSTQYQLEVDGTIQCKECPHYSGTVPGYITPGETEEICKCYPGYQPAVSTSDGGCEACPPAKYKGTLSNEDCVYCGDGEYSNGGARSCQSCPPNTYNIPFKSADLDLDDADEIGFPTLANQDERMNMGSTCHQCAANTISKRGEKGCTLETGTIIDLKEFLKSSGADPTLTDDSTDESINEIINELVTLQIAKCHSNASLKEYEGNHFCFPETHPIGNIECGKQHLCEAKEFPQFSLARNEKFTPASQNVKNWTMVSEYDYKCNENYNSSPLDDSDDTGKKTIVVTTKGGKCGQTEDVQCSVKDSSN